MHADQQLVHQSRTLWQRVGSAVGLSGGGATLCLLYFLFYGSGASWFPYFNIYLRETGLSGLEIGLLAGIRPAAMLISQPLWGVAGDMWGRRRTLLRVMFLAALLPLGYVLGTSFRFFILWTVLYTVLSNPVGALIDTLVLDHIEERPHLSFGRLRMWGAVGWGALAYVSGYIITGRDLRLIFVLGAITMLLGWGVAFASTHEQASAISLGKSWSGLRLLLRNRTLILFLGLVTFLQVGAASIFTFFPIYMDELGASSSQIGLAYGLQGIGELPLYLSAAAIISRIGAHRTLVLAFLAFAARTFLYAFISEPNVAAIVELSHGLSFSLFLVASVEHVDRIVPVEWRATGQSLFWAAYFGAGSILGNTWAGFLSDRIGVQRMFGINGWIILACALLAAILLRPHDAPKAG